MAATVTDKVIVITDRKEVLEPVEIALKRNNLEVVRGYMNLFSLSIIRKQVAGTKSLDFMGNEFYRFIREQGQPFAIILDGRINCGLGTAIDPDGFGLFQKLLMAGLVTAKGKGHEKYRGNYLLLAAGADRERIRNLMLSPKSLLGTLDASDKINASVIESYVKNIFQFGNRFYLDCAGIDGGSGEVMSTVERFIAEIRNRENLVRLKSEGASVDRESTDPARVVFAAPDGSVIVDGDAVGSKGDFGPDLNPGEFYVVGNWTSMTQSDVSRRITRIITKGINEDILFEKGDRIIININDRTRIDAATVASIAGLITKELVDYSNLTFVTNKEKGFIMKNSPGFGLIQKRVRMKG